MKKLVKIIFIIQLCVQVSQAYAGLRDCSNEKSWPQRLKANSINDCSIEANKIENECNEDSISTKSQKLKIYAINKCVENFMNSALDVRLLELKKSHPTQFKIEMQIQKNFNKSIKDSCGEFNNCEGTMYSLTMLSCIRNLLEWRTQIAEMINKKSLSLVAESRKGRLKNQSVALFISEMCKLPNDVYLSKKIPDDCQNNLMSLYVSKMGQDCHAENEL